VTMGLSVFHYGTILFGLFGTVGAYRWFFHYAVSIILFGFVRFGFLLISLLFGFLLTPSVPSGRAWGAGEA
jgi:hypothetical protein